MRISPINPAVIAMSLAVVAAPLLADDQHALDTEVAIVNLTGGDLHFEKKFNNMWTQWAQEPPSVITNTETVNFKMFIIDAAHFEICDGGATYRLDAGGTVSVRAANAVGGNWFYHQIKDVKPIPAPDGKGTTDLHVNAYGPETGRHIEAVFIISWTDLDQKVKKVDWKEVKENLNKDWKILKDANIGK